MPGQIVDPHEFSFIEQDAARVGRRAPFPAVRRIQPVVEGGDRISGLVWDTAPRFTFLHGGGQNAHTWDSTILALGAPTLALDLPGHGDSAWRSAIDYPPESMADPVAAAVRAETDQPQVVIGHSLGGLTAIAIAARHPDLVSRLVVIDVSPGLKPDNPSVTRAFLDGPEHFASRDEIIERGVRFGLGSTPESLRRGVVLNTRFTEDGRVVFKHHLARRTTENPGTPLSAASLWPLLESLEMPVLLVRGTKGIIDEADELEFVRRATDVRAISVKAAHNVHHEIPAELARIIAAFANER